MSSAQEAGILFSFLKVENTSPSGGGNKHPSAKRNIAGQIRGGHQAHIRMRRNTAALKLIRARAFRLWLCEPA